MKNSFRSSLALYFFIVLALPICAQHSKSYPLPRWGSLLNVFNG